MRVILAVVLTIVLACAVTGCRGVDQRHIYRIAREYVAQQVGPEADISSRDDALFALGKNAARVDLDYRRTGKNPIEGYMTVWCKRVRMRWEFDRAIDNRRAVVNTP